MPDAAPESPPPRPASAPTPDHCRRCRYPLGDLPTDAPCPECGSTHRQIGPHRILGDNLVRACGCVLLGLFMLIAGFFVWLLLLLVPAFGLTAVICGHLEQRSRRRLDLPTSYATIAVSVAGWILFLPPTLMIVLNLVLLVIMALSGGP